MPVGHADLRTAETTEFILLLPSSVLDDEARRDALLGRMEAAFPGSTFRAAECERLETPDGQPLLVTDPMVIPLMGSANTDGDPEPLRRRPPDHRMHEMLSTLRTFIAGASALN